eukprot:g31994.t1
MFIQGFGVLCCRGYLTKIEFHSKFVLKEGAERVPKLWAHTILRGCPILLVVTDILFLAVYLMSRGEYQDLDPQLRVP